MGGFGDDQSEGQGNGDPHGWARDVRRHSQKGMTEAGYREAVEHMRGARGNGFEGIAAILFSGVMLVSFGTMSGEGNVAGRWLCWLSGAAVLAFGAVLLRGWMRMTEYVVRLSDELDELDEGRRLAGRDARVELVRRMRGEG